MQFENTQRFKNLLKKDQSFLRTYNEHRDLDARIQKISKLKNPPPSLQQEAKKLKQLKLKKKDVLYKILMSDSA
jgi:uncharacterized protein YdcH (DUF465 family)